jgi:hypothetical protein
LVIVRVVHLMLAVVVMLATLHALLRIIYMELDEAP